MSKKKNHNYSPEFRAEAVKLVLEQGQSQEATFHIAHTSQQIFLIHSEGVETLLP